jgi:hypothetical protein
MPSVSISVAVSTTEVVSTGDTSVVTISSMVVTPQSAPVGTDRTLDVTANSSTGAVLTFATPVATGITFTEVTGQSAGHARWSFVY